MVKLKEMLTNKEIECIPSMSMLDSLVIDLKWKDLYVLGKTFQIVLEHEEFIPDMLYPAFAIQVLTERIKGTKHQLF